MEFLDLGVEALVVKVPGGDGGPDQRAVVEQIRKVIDSNGEFRMMLYAKNSWKDAMIDGGFDQPEAQSGCPIATSDGRTTTGGSVAMNAETMACWADSAL